MLRNATEERRKLVEQLLILLLETYRPPLFSKPSTTDPGWLQDMAAAQTLTQIANAARARSGWMGACRRPDFGATGLNWNSPLFEGGGESLLYTRRQMPDRSLHFTRGPITLSKNLMILEHGNTKSNNRRALNLQIHPANPPIGTTINVTAEISRAGAKHPKSFLRTPDAMPWNDMKELQRFAVRLEWKDDQKGWVRMYPRCNWAQIQYTDKEDVSACWKSINTIRDWMNFFLLREYRNAPDYFSPTGIARLVDLQFNFKDHIITMNAVPRQAEGIDWPGHYDFTAMGDVLK